MNNQMQQINRDITFRRINGRIIPIKLNKNKAELKQGVGMIGAGSGTAWASGKAYRAVNSYATAKSVKAFRTIDKINTMMGSGTLFGFVRKQQAAKLANKAARAGQIIGKFSAPLRIGGQLAAATLIGAGATKIIKGTKKDNKDKIAAAAGALAFGGFLTGAYKMSGLRTAIKPYFVKAYPKIRKLKTSLHL